MRWLSQIGAWTFVLALIGISLLEGSCIQSQLRRDRDCVSMLNRSVERIEAFRAQNSRLPTTIELGRMGLSLIDYQVTGSAAAGGEQYVLKDWRGERTVEYHSATHSDTCGSGAWIAAACLAGVTLPLWLLAFVWMRRLRRPASA